MGEGKIYAEHMSGHSKWATIKRAKGANDVKRGAVFTKLANAITVAVRDGGGGDPSFNFKLRLAAEKARAENMPKENIQRAIDKGLGKGEGGQLAEVVFEGFGPHGVAVMVEAITDNNNRTANEVRAAFAKNNGNLGTSGSVGYLFTRVGEIEIEKGALTTDQILETALEAEASDVEENSESYAVFTVPGQLHKVKEILEKSGLVINDVSLVFRPNKETLVKLTGEDEIAEVENFLSLIEDLEDVQRVFVNLAQ